MASSNGGAGAQGVPGHGHLLAEVCASLCPYCCSPDRTPAQGYSLDLGLANAEGFEELKHRLSTAPILLVPDFSLPFQMDTDVSYFTIGADLQQDQGKVMQPM